MLKALWRKLGAGEAQPEGFRILPHITHTGEFHLERLVALLKQRYSHQFRAAWERPEDDAIRDMISFAARIQDQDVQRELLLFYLNCSPVIQEYLRQETDLGDGGLFSR
ncbi:hypothetical protein [Marinobacter sp. C2H3]|uniref:hypothetical protein n=1 Tax=Marinobacter sp. C2H3 TaxID=3119003 RepID=UPI00300F0C1C